MTRARSATAAGLLVFCAFSITPWTGYAGQTCTDACSNPNGGMSCGQIGLGCPPGGGNCITCRDNNDCMPGGMCTAAHRCVGLPCGPGSDGGMMSMIDGSAGGSDGASSDASSSDVSAADSATGGIDAAAAQTDAAAAPGLDAAPSANPDADMVGSGLPRNPNAPSTPGGSSSSGCGCNDIAPRAPAPWIWGLLAAITWRARRSRGGAGGGRAAQSRCGGPGR